MAMCKLWGIVGVGLLVAFSSAVRAQEVGPFAEIESVTRRLAEAETQLDPPPEPEVYYCPSVGYDNGFYIKSQDGCFSWKTRGLIQFRYIADWRDLDPASTDDNFEGGFQLMRANLFFSGRIGYPNLKYSIVLAPNRNTGIVGLEEAQIKYKFANGTEINAGRFRNLAFLREEATSYTRQLTAERSYLNEIFTIDYVEGVGLTRQGDVGKLQFVVSDGRRSGSSATRDFNVDNTDIALTARWDLKLAGDWKQMGDFASWCGEDWGVFAGAAFHWEEGETGDALPANDLNNFVSWTVDGSIEGYGFNLYAAGVGRHSTNPGLDIDQTGFLAQGGYMVVPDTLEPFIRWESINFDGFGYIDGVDAVADSTVDIVTFGVNRYFNKHSAKLTMDVMYACDPIPFAMTHEGFLVDSAGRDGQVVWRTQMQLFY